MTQPLVVVCGPTGSGKSSLAIWLARRFSGEIMSADSLQVFRHFNIGTAKVSDKDRVEVPHHLIDAVDPQESFTAGDYVTIGRKILVEVTDRGNLPIVAGGTGFYIRALIDGLSPVPAADPDLRVRLSERERRRSGSLHRVLERLDPVSAGRIHANDVPKLIRALEIRLLSRRNPSEQAPRLSLQRFRILRLVLLPPRERLYGVLDSRSEWMMEHGLLDEIRGLLAAGVPRSAKPFQSLGYKEGLAVIDGRISREEALTEMKRDTRRYAKRQVTWFRREPEATVLEGFGDDPEIRSSAAVSVDRLVNSE